MVKIDILKNELEKIGYKGEIKNKNELYIEITKEQIKDGLNLLINKYKCNFAAEFCREEEEFIIDILLVNRHFGYFVIIEYRTQDELISLQDIIFQAHLFEREIKDLYGLNITDGIDTRNLVKHEVWESKIYPLRKSFPFGNKIALKNEEEEYKFKPISGEGAYQIPVGPVHAGIIEPGHFRFSVIGEPIENLEIRLMYKHRGIEKLCENVDVNKLNLVFERVAGESSAAYSECYALLIEKLLNYEADKNIKALRTVILELERIYNFIDDIAGICLDVGFSYPSKKYSYFSEQIHQLCEFITGSRFLRNTIVPMGINIDFSNEKKAVIIKKLNEIRPRFEKIVKMTLDAVSFLDRVENTGLVHDDKARKLGLTGIVGRSCGISFDVRHSFPYEFYKECKQEVKTEVLGGVFERYKLKVVDIQNSFEVINKALNSIKDDIKKDKRHFDLKEGSQGIAAVETVKGALVVYGKVGTGNKFDRVYFKTPSFTNWNGLTYAVLNEIVPDFPLCNKSFNMSYSENDR